MPKGLAAYRLPPPPATPAVASAMAAGRNISASLALPLGFAGEVGMRVARRTSSTPSVWPAAAQTADLSMEGSSDGGATWTQLASSLGETGGVQLDPTGAEMPYSWLLCYVRADLFPLVRGVAAITGAVFMSSVEIMHG